MTEKHILSKSTFLRGLQCHKSLYLNRYRRDLRDEVSPDLQAVFSTGREVGELARGLFPGGVQSKPPNSFQFQRAVEVTRELIEGGKDIIYEAAFQHERVLALVDILVREGDKWHAYEVKSSASLKDVHIPDAGIQYYIMQGQGIKLADLSIVYLNTTSSACPTLFPPERSAAESETKPPEDRKTEERAMRGEEGICRNAQMGKQL